MKITRISVYKSSIPLKEPFVISLGPLTHADNVIVKLDTDSGVSGLGECSPFPTIHGETQETCFNIGQQFGGVLLGQDPVHTDNCIASMEQAISGNRCIKSAFDMALYDIASIHAGLPLYEYLGGRNDKKIITDYTISIATATKMAADAKKIIEAGFTIIKVKLGGRKDDDVERMRLIRQAVGNHIPLRIDANQGWRPEEAVDILKALAAFGIMHCEEPIDRRLFTELPNIRKQSPIPIMADESCFNAADAECLIGIGACDMINIKLGKSGIHGARKILELARNANMTLQAGGFLESRLGFTAAAHVALSDINIRHYDFDTPLMFLSDPVKGGINYGTGGVITVPDLPGIGATMDELYLEKLEKVILE